MTSNKWLSVEGLAQYLSISKETVYRWLEKGSVPSHKVGRLWRFSESEIDEWVKGGGAAGSTNSTKQNPDEGKNPKCN